MTTVTAWPDGGAWHIAGPALGLLSKPLYGVDQERTAQAIQGQHR